MHQLPQYKTDLKKTLSFLEPDSKDTGWHASRNPVKVLNHIELLKEKEDIATKLGLHNIHCEDSFQDNWAMLRKHQEGNLTTSDTIGMLHKNTKISEWEIKSMLKSYSRVGHLEFHPSDICNLACAGCSYGHDLPDNFADLVDDELITHLKKIESTDKLGVRPAMFPFDSIQKILAFKPKSITIVGGGEPFLYRNKGHGFNDLVSELRELQNVTLGVITNATTLPIGDWTEKLDWLRISVDAASPEMFKQVRPRKNEEKMKDNAFENVIENFLYLLSTPIQNIGVSFLYSNINVHEYANFADYIYNTVNKYAPENIHKVGITFKPLMGDPGGWHQQGYLAISPTQINSAVADVISLAKTSKNMARFLKEQTTITSIVSGNTHTPQEFNRCYITGIKQLIRANGDLRPCFCRTVQDEFNLGNVITDTVEKLALNSLYIASAQKKDCDSDGCRLSGSNNLLQLGLSGKLQRSTFSEVRNDYGI